MEFHEKLVALRRARGITQEELAAALYVSRTAVSKWESGRGYPSLDSLRALAGYFSVTVDALLSGGELLSVAEAEQGRRVGRLCELLFGLLDISLSLYFLLPLFAIADEGGVRALTLLTWGPPPLQTAALVLTGAVVLWGILTLALQGLSSPLWQRLRYPTSLILCALTLLFLIAARQPYAAALLFSFLSIKGLLLLRR